ncbi:MAG: phosphate ABC transporter substrate-binding protein PstS [Flaviflexus sp.]|nr:phosphate ABC transporter substrate-binding protein PstS [Flaviflexus sp.]
MKIPRSGPAVAMSALALVLSACGSNETSNIEETTAGSQSEEHSEHSDHEHSDGSDFSSLSGTLNGSGASSQGKAMQAWKDGFGAVSDVKVNYTETGSGTGREQFIGGEVSFIGTDAALKPEEMAAATERCGGAGVVETPTYVSPIAVAFNLPGIEHVNMSAENIAEVFNGKITMWNDPKLVENNPDIELPDMAIITVNRADKSGTTENFTDYLAQVVPDVWGFEAAQEWPVMDGVLGQSAEGTSGVVSLVQNTEGGITYADASQIGELGSVAVKIGDEFIPYSAEAAAKIVDGSPAAADASDTVLTVDLQRDGSIEGAYPIVLISYHVACLEYDDEAEAANVAGLLTYIASVDGQNAAADHAGIAPISEDMRERVNSAIAKISAK